MIITFLAIIILMRVVQSIYNKKVSILLPQSISAYINHITILYFFATGFAFATFVLEGNFGGINLETVLIAICLGFFLVLSSFCGIISLQGGTIVLNSVFATGGIIVNCILGRIVFNELMTFPQIICIIVLLFSMILLIDSSKKIFGVFSFKTGISLIGSLISNGMTMFFQKLFGETQPNGNVSMFSMLSFLIPAIVLLIYLLIISKPKGKTEPLSKKIWMYTAFLAVAVFVIQQFVTILTPLMSAAVLSTFVLGGTMVVAAIVGVVVYKERITFKSAVGIILGITSIVCMKLFEISSGL